LSAACAFLSHPAHGGREATPLHEHLARVAVLARGVAGRMRPEAADDAFVAGLLHDIGKLSPWYQKMFAGEGEDVLRAKYGLRQHSLFSAWAARHLLFGRPCAHDVIHAIAGHHGGLKTRLPTLNDRKSADAQREMLSNLEGFRDLVCSASSPESESWGNMKWDGCMESFGSSVNFSERIVAGGNGGIGAYLRSKCVYSSLLQADRGSFHDVQRKALSMRIQPTHAGTPTSEVGRLRKSFQDTAFADYLQSANKRIMVIEAPTGIGKTDLIFRILGHHSEKKSHDRAFYFSPLLALTDGFVAALMGEASTSRPAVPEEGDRDRVLEYNHMTAEPISRRSEDEGMHEKIGGKEQSSVDLYETASFGYPFVVSTTARLLLTIYGNLASNCIKFASLANAVIIVDEIQTVPKFLLKSLIEALSWIAESSGSKVVLVSATIPSEISDMGIHEIRCDERVADSFAALTPKILSVAPSLDDRAIMDAVPTPTAVIFNTRRRATEFYRGADTLRKRYGEIIYLTSGIRKRDRLDHIRRIASESQPKSALVVSTQILEAGVDASFGRMFREMAPLDSIVQAMGRLNRHGGSEAAEITVFDKGSQRPYRQVEIDETQKILDSLTSGDPVTSAVVYAKLREYYKSVSDNDGETRTKSEELERHMSKHDYDSVWEIVRGAAFADYNVNVFLPYSNEDTNAKPETRFDSVLGVLEGLAKEPTVGRRRAAMRRIARLSAALPESSLGRVKHLLDPALLERGVCAPRDDGALTKIYDAEIGLDKWVCPGEPPC